MCLVFLIIVRIMILRAMCGRRRGNVNGIPNSCWEMPFIWGRAGVRATIVSHAHPMIEIVCRGIE